MKLKEWLKIKLFSKETTRLSLAIVEEEKKKDQILDPDWIGNSMSKEEEEIVAVIATSIVAGDKPDSYFKIKKIIPIDEDYELAGILCTTIAAGERPDSSFQVKRIQRIK